MEGKSDYYSEEKTLSAASTNRSHGIKLYGKDLRDLDDVDLESLLAKLSPEELEDLNNDFDPDNSLLPPSQRCRDQTNKEPTGPFQREKLLNYLEESAKTERDWDEKVPFSPGVKRGKVWEPKDDEEETEKSDRSGAGRGMEMPIELDVDDDDDDEELSGALAEAPEKDLVDLAGILGMHNMLSQPQYYNALRGKPQDATSGTSFTGIVKAALPKLLPEEGENDTDVDAVIERLEADDELLVEVNLNNMKRVSRERMRTLVRSAAASSHLRKLSLANTAITDSEARPLVDLLETSSSLQVLNIESNFISPELLAKLLRATLKTQVLVEFHAENQRASVLGNQIEMDMMQSVEENETLLRVGVAFSSMEARHRVSEALERNYERVRLRRLESSS